MCRADGTARFALLGVPSARPTFQPWVSTQGSQGLFFLHGGIGVECGHGGKEYFGVFLIPSELDFTRREWS